MAGTGFKGPLVHGPRSTADGYGYRAGLGMMPSAEFNVLHEDFNTIFTTNAIPGWAAIIDTGCTNVTNTTAAIGAPGVMSMTSDTTSEGSALYAAKSVQLTAGKKAFIECRVRLPDVTDNAFQFGLSDLTAVTNPEDLWTTTAANVLSFGILDGSATTGMLADASNAGTAVVAGTKVMVIDTWHTLAIYFDGVRAYGFVDGDLSVSTATTVPTGVALAPFIGHLNGDGSGTDSAFVDYIRVVSER